MEFLKRVVKEEVNRVLREDMVPGTNFPEGEYSVSDKTLRFLSDWQWNKPKLRKYQNKGLSVIPNDIVEELRKYRPDTSIVCWRVFGSLEGEMKSRKNKLLSFMPYKEVAFDMMENYIFRKRFESKNILVDTTMIPERPEDVIPEVIYINE